MKLILKVNLMHGFKQSEGLNSSSKHKAINVLCDLMHSRTPNHQHSQWQAINGYYYYYY